MFNKLILVCTIYSLVLCKEAVIVDKKDVPKHNPDFALIGRYDSMIADGILKINDYYEAEDDNYNSYSYFDLKSQTPAPTFMAISEENITGLEIGWGMPSYQYNHFKDCYSVSLYWKYQILIAYNAYFIDGSNIIPSLTYQVYNGPKYYSRIVHRNGIIYREKKKIDSTCKQQNYFWESVFHNGVVDQLCIHEDFASIPGYGIDYFSIDPWLKGSPPKLPEECYYSDDVFSPKYKGYGQGQVTDGNITTLKEAITKYGPVLISYGHYAKEDSTQPDGFIHYDKGIYDQIVVGWDEEKFITVAIVSGYETVTIDGEQAYQYYFQKEKGEIPFTGTCTQYEYNQQLGYNVQVQKEYDNIFIDYAYFFAEAEEEVYLSDEITDQEIDEEDLPDPDPDIGEIEVYDPYDDDGLQYNKYFGDYNDFRDIDLRDVETAETFQAIPIEKILDLKASKEVTQEDISELNKCEAIHDQRSLADLLAYTAYFVDQSDIYPSMTHLYSNGPKYQWSKWNIDGTNYKYIEPKEDYNCQRSYDFEPLQTIQQYGIIDESCIPNNFSQIPNYGWKDGDEYVSGIAPKLPDQCVNSEVEFDPKLKVCWIDNHNIYKDG